MRIQIYSAPSVEPITLANTRTHLRLVATGSPLAHDDDDYVTNLIVAAREWVENFTRRALVQRTYDYWLDAFPNSEYIDLPRPPLQSVTSFTYTDSDETETTLTEGTDFSVDSDSEPGRLVLDPDESSWPTVTLHPDKPIKVRYTAGYDAGGSNSPPDDYRINVPQSIKHAMYLIIGHWYNMREETIVGLSAAEIPMGAKALLAPYRISWRF